MYNVLLVENNEGLRNSLKEELKKRGVDKVVEDEKGAKAFSLLKKDKFDLIILDIDLPGVNGFLIANRIRKNDKFKEIPMVIISEKSSEDKFEKHKETPTAADMYLHLPLNADELINKAFLLLEEPALSIEDDDADDEFDLGDDLNLEDLETSGSSDDIDDFDLGLDDDIDKNITENDDIDLDLGLDGDDDIELDLSRNDIDENQDLNLDEGDDILGNITSDESIMNELAEEEDGLSKEDDKLDKIEGENNENILEDSQGESLDIVAADGVDIKEYETLKEELNLKDSKIKELEGIIEELKNQKSDTEVNVSQIDELNKKIESLNNTVKEKDDEISALKSAMDSRGDSGKSSTREVLRLKQELTQKGREIIEFKELYNSKEREVLDLKDNCNNLELKLADQEDLISGYRRKISITEDELNKLKNDFNELMTQKDNLELENTNLKNELSDKDVLISNFKQTIEENEKLITELKTELDTKNKEINEVLLPAKQSLEVDLDRFKNELSELKAKYEDISAKYKEAQDKIVVLEKRSADNYEKFKEIELQKSKIKQLLEAATGILEGIVINTEE